MATCIRMYYNPYLCTLKMFLIDKSGKELDLDGSARDDIADKYSERFLLEDNGDDLLNILSNGYRGSHIRIEFVGTNHSFKYLQKLCNGDNYKKTFTVFMSKKYRILSCDEISKKIQDSVSQLKEQGYDIDTEDKIGKILDASIPVLVVGNMSSGKSTFLNALIGEELLPAGQDRTTGVICRIHNSKQDMVVSYTSQGNDVKIDCTDVQSLTQSVLPESLKSGLINERPIGRIRRIIDYFNTTASNEKDNLQLIDNRLLDISCPFFNKDIPEQIVFLDTPGNNSDSYKGDADTLREALEGQTKGFIIFVCNQRADLDKAEELIITIQESTGNKLDLDHTIVVCNQMEKEPVINSKTVTEQTWATRIIYLSSAISLGARKPCSESKEKWKEQDLFSVYYNMRASFSDPNHPCYLSLPKFCTLPDNRKNGISDEEAKLVYETQTAADEDKAKKALMQFNAGITIVEQEIIFVANELFPYNQCERARTVFIELLEEYKRKIELKESEKGKHRQARIDDFNTIYEPVCEALSQLTDNFVNNSQTSLVDRYDASDCSYKTEKGEMFATLVIDKLLTADSYKEKNEESIRSEIIEQLNIKLDEVIASSEKFFRDFLHDEVIPGYTSKCVKEINGQESISESEKKAFCDFFTVNNLEDKTEEKRKEKEKELKLDVPNLQDEDCIGDKWYERSWKVLKNSTKKIAYWFKKHMGNIKGDITEFYSNAYITFSEDILKQLKANIYEIFNSIKASFSDQSSDNNIICELHPKLGTIKREITKINNDIAELNRERTYIEKELAALNNIFPK